MVQEQQQENHAVNKMHKENQGEDVPARVTAWDFLALFSNFLLEFTTVLTRFFDGLTTLFINQANFVDEKKNFHEYAARTIEKLREGE